MNTRICAVLVLMMAMGTAGAQMMSSHAPTGVAPAPTSNVAPRASAGAGRLTMAPAMQETGKPVARVNGVELIDRDLLREMYALFPYASQHNGFPKDLEPEIRSGALQMIIFEELVYQEAKRRKLTIPPATLTSAEAAFKKQFPSQRAYQQFLQSETKGSEAAMREKIRRSLLIEALLKQEVTNPARVTTSEAKAEYDKTIAAYKHPELLRIQSISIIPPDATQAVLAEAKKRADDAAKRAKLAKSYRDFGLLAEQISDDDFHVNMGDHKPQPAIALPPPIVLIADKMKPGDVSDLIKLGNNYTIFRLESQTPAGIAPFTEVKPKLQSDMQKKKTEQLRSAFAQKLHQNAKIETL
jgi:parvulin-like peptidyl-prolyl isomerase